MGLLDDAIRQHLELKRQHGADPGEVAEKERQAFGPIKRGDLEVGPAAEEDDLLHEEETPFAPEEPTADEPVVEATEASGSVAFEAGAEPIDEVAPAATERGDSETIEEEPFVAPFDEPFAPSAEPAAFAPSPAEHPEPAVEPPTEPPPSESFQDIGEPTQEYTVVDDAPDPQPDAAPGEHDELEETPDFLEETPEHDRLWFEQKPPRDFDF